MALVVVRAGTFATIQDRGRPGYRSFGVPVGGAFDLGMLGLANALLGNDPDDAAIELTMVGGAYLAEVDLAVALAGAPMAATIRRESGVDRAVEIPRSLTLRAGDLLTLGGASQGARTYLAVRGGWRTPLILGSRSTERRLEAGDVLPAEPGSTPERWPAETGPRRIRLLAPSSLVGERARGRALSGGGWVVRPRREGRIAPDNSRQLPRFDDGPIRVVDGPDADPSTGGARFLESGEYRVTPLANRMGLRLEGPAIDLEGPPDRISAPVGPGAVQVAGGRLIVLGVAGGTMGGYPHPAHVITADLDRLAQLRPGDPVRFRRVEVEEAREVDRLDRRSRATWLAVIRAAAGGGRGLD